MSDKIYFTDGEPPSSQIGSSLESLAKTISDRRSAGEQSYTYRLLEGPLDTLLKKLVEEAHETTLAAKDVEVSAYFAREADAIGAPEDQRETLARAAEDAVNHLRYEAGDVVYHLLVVLERCGIDLDEFAAELNSRMTKDDIALRSGVAMLDPACINRGKREA